MILTIVDTENQIKYYEYDDDIIKLDLSKKQIRKVRKLDGLINLQELNLEGNQITDIKGLEKLTKLQRLNLSNNQIVDIKRLEGLDQLINLQVLNLNLNQIKEITGLEQLINLRLLELNLNYISEIKGLEKLTNLKELYLNQNKITEIKGFDQLINLQKLSILTDNVSNIYIKELKGLDKLTNLQTLFLRLNHYHTIESTIILLNNINLIEIFSFSIHPLVQRMIDRNIIKNNKLNSYNNSENVHDSTIHKSISQSIYSILNEKFQGNLLNDILNESILSTQTKSQLIDYCNINTIHSTLNVSFQEVLDSVWSILNNHQTKNDILNILNTDMNDSICKCFTGRIIRLINCLNRFDTRVNINISQNDELSNIIVLIKTKYPNNVIKQKEESQKELFGRGFDQNTIDEWTSYLEE